MRHTWLLPAVVILALLFPSPSSALDPSVALTQYGVASWQIEDGLPGNSINAMLQTRDGYVWLGTQEGVVRFDGVRFTVFDRQNTPQIKGNDVEVMTEDASGALWIGTYGGAVTRYQDGVFTHYGRAEGLPDDNITGLVKDPQGTVLAATISGALLRFDGTRFQKMEVEGLPPVKNISVLYVDDRNRVYLGCKEGLVVIDGKKVDFLPSGSGFPEGGVISLCRDRDGVVWFGVLGGGLYRLIGRTIEPVGEWTGGMVPALLCDEGGTLWLGTDGAGLSRLGKTGFTFRNTATGLTSDIVISLGTDREGNLWLGTRGGGISILRNQKLLSFTSTEGLSHNNVRSLTEGPDGSIYAATYGGGISRMTAGTFSSLDLPGMKDGEFASSVTFDSRGALWIGTKTGGVYEWQNGQLHRYGIEDGLPGKQVFSTYPDPEGGVWIGTSAGLALIRDQKIVTAYTAEQGAVGGAVFCILRDVDHSLWVGTLKGLTRLRDGRFETFTAANGLSSNIVLSLYQDTQKVLWIGTVGGGLCQYRDGRFASYTTASGLIDENVYSILEDSRKNLWLSGNKGIFSVRKTDLEAFSRKQIRQIPVTGYGTADGMKSRECNGGTQPSAHRLQDGRLIFPTIRGFVMVDIERLKPNTIVPPVHIQRVTIDGRDQDPAALKETPPGSERVEFHFTALSFVAPEKIRFRYRLEGFDRKWVEPGGSRTASYTNLPPGDYRFHVIASNNDGVWNEAGASVAFRQVPLYYQTYWFYALVFVVILSLGLGAHRLRTRALKSRQAELSRMVEERTLDLSIARERLAEANLNLERRVKEGIDALREAERMAAYGNMVAGVAHEVRQPVFALQAASYVLQERLKDNESIRGQLRTLERETRRMTALMDDLLEFAKPPALVTAPADPASVLREALEIFQGSGDSSSVEVQIDAAGELPEVIIDKSRMLQVFQNLMANARKHAEGMTRLRLVAEREKEAIRFLIQDNGAGISAEHLEHIFEPFYTTGKGTGLGLAIVNRIVEDHGGSIRVQSAPDQGTTFIITLPVRGRMESRSA